MQGANPCHITRIIAEKKGYRVGIQTKGKKMDCGYLEFFRSKIGESFFFRTVTYHLTGRVKSVVGNIIELENASWIADSGRFTQAIKEGVLAEVEPVGKAYINASSITDFFPWVHQLPNSQQ